MRKICFVTGARAEYGLLKSLIDEFISDDNYKIQIIATGMHLSPEFGLTYKEIENDGFHINEKLEILLSSDTRIGVSKAMGLAMISFAEAYERLKPDLIIGLGDRFELFAAVSAAMVKAIRNVEKSLGNGIKKPSHSEAKNMPIARKSIVAVKPIKKGEIFTEKNIGIKRPGSGISSMR